MSVYWERSEGDEAVVYGYQAPYTARIVEGRVWRWQVGDEREACRIAGRTTRGMREAQQMCALAMRLLALSDEGADVEGLPSGEAVTWGMVVELRDQIRERDEVIAQMGARLEAMQGEVTGEGEAKGEGPGEETGEETGEGEGEVEVRPKWKEGDRVRWEGARGLQVREGEEEASDGGDHVGVIWRLASVTDGWAWYLVACERTGKTWTLREDRIREAG